MGMGLRIKGLTQPSKNITFLNKSEEEVPEMKAPEGGSLPVVGVLEVDSN